MLRPEGGLSGAGIVMIVAIFFLFRISYAGYRELVPDEAVYWAWSRHLAGGYLDHPPMIAWMIHASCRLFNLAQPGAPVTEFAVRVPAVLCGVGSLILVLCIAAILGFERRLYGWLLAIWLTSPLLAAMGTLVTPDSPAIFFSQAAVLLAVWVAQRSTPHENGKPPPQPSPGVPGEGEKKQQQLPGPHEPSGKLARDPFRPLLWLGFGVCCGLALLSKYTTILVPAAVFLALLTSRRLGRRHLMQPWIYLSAIPAAAIFYPVIAWNRAHQWISFRYQLNHGLDTDRPTLLRGLGEFIGGQALIWTPVLFVVAVIVLVYFWKRVPVRRSAPAAAGSAEKSMHLTLAQRLLLMNATLPLVFFGYAATRAHGEVNWPAFAYFPLSLLMVQWLAEGKAPASAEPAESARKGKPPARRSARAKLMLIGCIVAAVGLVIVQAPEMVYRITPRSLRSKLPSKLNETFGWKKLAQQISQSAGDAVVVCNRHQYAGELAFYMPGQPDVWAVSEGSRPTAWDYFDYQPPLATFDQIAFVGKHDQQFTKQLGIAEEIDGEMTSMIFLPDGRHRDVRLVLLSNLYNRYADFGPLSIFPQFRLDLHW